MNHSDLLRLLSDRFNNKITELSEDMARGTAKDHGEYKYACGIVRGLSLANGMLRDVVDETENDEDD
jgi:hypothetical protein